MKKEKINKKYRQILMKQITSQLKQSKRALTWISVTLALLGVVLVWRAYAAGPEMYLSSESTEVAHGSELTVQVRADSLEETVNAVQSNLNYPADKLVITNIDYTGSAFGIQAEETVSDGLIKLARGTITPVSGDFLIATITFEVTMTTGSATVEFAEGTALVRNSDSTNILVLASGQTYSIADLEPEPTPPPPPEPTPPPPEPSPPPPPAPEPVDAVLSIEPASQELEIDLSAPVQIRLDTDGATVNAVQANLTYPADKIGFVSIDTGAGDFGIEAETSSGDGSVRIARGSIEPKEGSNLLVATITFRALVGSGTAAVSFADGSAVIRSGDNTDILGGTSTGQYLLKGSTIDNNPPPPPPAPSPYPTPPQPTPSPSPTPTPSPTPPPPPAAVSPSPLRRAITSITETTRDLITNDDEEESTPDEPGQQSTSREEEPAEEVRFTTNPRGSLGQHISAVLDTNTGKAAAGMLAVSIITIGGILFSSALGHLRPRVPRGSMSAPKPTPRSGQGGRTVYPEKPISGDGQDGNGLDAQ